MSQNGTTVAPDAAIIKAVGAELERLMSVERVERAPVVYQDGQLVPSNIEGLFRIASMYWRGGMAPEKSFKTVEAVAVALATGRRLGLSDLQALAYIAIINGRPSLWGEAIPGLIYKSGNVKLFEESFEGLGPNGEFTENAVAVCRMERKDVAGVKVARFGWSDAKRAGLTSKDTYRNYPLRMLRWRALGWCAKDAFPDVLLGLNVAEEVLDIPAAADREAAGVAPVSAVGREVVIEVEPRERAKPDPAAVAAAQAKATEERIKAEQEAKAAPEPAPAATDGKGKKPKKAAEMTGEEFLSSIADLPSPP